jgi:predicted nucleotidyltransferase
MGCAIVRRKERAMRDRSEAEVDIEPVIRVAADRLAHATNAESVILFGSRARGDNHPDSDWDICVLVPDDVESGQFTPATLRPIVADLPAAIQIFPLRRSVFENKRANRNSMSHDIDRDGIVLVAAPGWTPSP